MSTRSLSLRFAAMVLLLLPGAARLGAQIAAVSPFLPAQGAPGAGAPTANAPLEFRGVLEDNEGLKFRIVDPARKMGAFVRLNEREPTLELVVKRHDASGGNDTIVVEQRGQTFTLPLRTAKVSSMGSMNPQMAAPPPGAPPNMPPAITNSVVVNPTAADEQRRLEAVAAEVARRRALREQAQQQVGQPAPGMTPAVVPPQLPVAQPAMTPGPVNAQQRGRGGPVPGNTRQQ